jgi:hypothetical protein
MAIRKTQEEFIKQSKKIFGDVLDYSLVEYRNRRSKVTLVCKIHGSFQKLPDNHLVFKDGCPECGVLQRAAIRLGITLEEYELAKANGQRYCKHHGLLELGQYYLVKSKPDYLCKICVRNKHIKFRTEVLSAYSTSLECALCMESHLEFLALDHINGGGTKDIKQHGGQSSLWCALKRNGYPDGYRVLCHNCNHKQRIYNLDTNSQDYKERIKIRSDVIGHYGGKCSCCGDDELEVLCIDHINGGGRAQARELKSQGTALTYYWIKRNGYPPDYQVLCHNCNMAKGIDRTCPHKAVE